MISPWVIYFCNFADTIKIISLLLGIIFVLFWLIEVTGFEVNNDSARRFGVIAGILLFVAVVVPSKKTCLEMLVVSMITPENLAMGKDVILDLVKEIMEIVSAK